MVLKNCWRMVFKVFLCDGGRKLTTFDCESISISEVGIRSVRLCSLFVHQVQRRLTRLEREEELGIKRYTPCNCQGTQPPLNLQDAWSIDAAKPVRRRKVEDVKPVSSPLDEK
ncbi:hypothetical protein AKJ16_DCAP04942 [Drosera capensis]